MINYYVVRNLNTNTFVLTDEGDVRVWTNKLYAQDYAVYLEANDFTSSYAVERLKMQPNTWLGDNPDGHDMKRVILQYILEYFDMDESEFGFLIGIHDLEDDIVTAYNMAVVMFR